MSKLDAIAFTLRCQNWAEIAVPIATHRPTTKIVLRSGLRFTAPDLHWYEIDQISFKHIYDFRLPIERNDVVVDIGANIGLFTVYAASKTQNTVYAYEPSPSNFELLKENILANELNNAIPHRLAVSKKSGETELLFEAENRVSRRLKSVAPGETEKYAAVSTTTLQEIMDSNNIEQIGFLKIDCEGSEAPILESTSKSYFKRIKKISMEFHDDIAKINHYDMQKLLEEAGFTTEVQWDGKSPLGYIFAWRD